MRTLLSLLPPTPTTIGFGLGLSLRLCLGLANRLPPASILGKNPLGGKGGSLEQRRDILNRILKKSLPRPSVNGSMPPEHCDNGGGIRSQATQMNT